MRPHLDLDSSILFAWETNNRVTEFLIEHIPARLWIDSVPGYPRRKIRSIGAHIHNVRCGWIRTLGRPFRIPVPGTVNKGSVTQRQLIAALKRSSQGIAALLRLGFKRGGTIPSTKAYVWRNLPLDVGHVLVYFVAHEAHHRGQVIMVARQLKYKLTADASDGIWEFRRREREHTGSR